MKPVFITLMLTGLTLNGYSQTETETSKEVKLSKNYFYLSPFNMIVEQFQLGYERDFGKTRHGMLFLGSVILGGNQGYYYPYNQDGRKEDNAIEIRRTGKHRDESFLPSLIDNPEYEDKHRSNFLQPQL